VKSEEGVQMKSLLVKIIGIGMFLILVFLLTSTISFGQEKRCCCAWMLWKIEMDKESKTPNWVILDAFPNYEACKKSQAFYENRFAERINKGEEAYKCFPDTFSPIIVRK
jgi:hypothetical protein